MPKWLVVVLWAVVLGLAWSVTFKPIRADNDCWWHVKTGKYIAENGIPETDVFSFTASDHRWDNHEWLSQVAMWEVWKLGDATGLGGWRAVILLTTVVSMLVWAGVGLLVQSRVRHWGVALLIAVVAVAIGRRTLYPRPPVVTYGLLALTLWILYQVRLGRWPVRRLWVLAPLTAVWSNLHGGWMAGLVAMAIFAFDGLVRFTYGWWRGLWEVQGAGGGSGTARAGDREPAPEQESAEGSHLRAQTAVAFRQARGYALVLVACVVASWCNPFGWRLWLLPGRVMGDLELVRQIGELRSPDFYFTVAFELAILLTLAGLALVRRRPFVLADLLLFLFWAHQGIQHVRHLPMFAVAGAPLMGVVAREALRELHASRIGRRFLLERWSGLPVAVMAICLAGYVVMNPREGQSYLVRNRALLDGVEYVRENYPTGACDFALVANIGGRMFNRNNYAGYLIWRLAPEQAKVFTDSRFDIFGSKFLRDEILIGTGNEDPRLGLTWREGLDQYEVVWVLMPASEGLHGRLLESEGWELVFVEPRPPLWRDPWVIWIRKSGETEAMRERAVRQYEALTGRRPGMDEEKPG
jgi:hypothetical protein